ncbi:hypothetical protein HDU67_003695, partial [Dinochytrium kinnereticum]
MMQKPPLASGPASKRHLTIDTSSSAVQGLNIISHANHAAVNGLASPLEPPMSAPVTSMHNKPTPPPPSHIPLPASAAPNQQQPQVSNPEFLRRYRLGACLGSGGFGFVCVATRIADGIEVAVKFILKEKVPRTNWVRDEVLGVVPMEVFVLRRIRHENIIRYVDYFDDPAYCLLVTELHGGNWSGASTTTSSAVPSLSQTSISSNAPPTPVSPALMTPPALQRRNSCDLFECIELMERFTEEQAKHVFRQIASAVAYLSSNGIVHRDIKDENILIDDSFNVKLIDFGSACFMSHHDGLFLGTLQYAAPEIFEGHRNRGAECEVWSLGCCLYIMLTGEVPFPTPHDVRFSRPQPLRPNVAPLTS